MAGLADDGAVAAMSGCSCAVAVGLAMRCVLDDASDGVPAAALTQFVVTSVHAAA
jgi:hypothetical protein